jgi:hypothetical protein
MPISGYDPDDLDGLLEQLLDEGDLRAHLTDDQWTAYEDGEEELTDILDDDDVERLLSSTDE